MNRSKKLIILVVILAAVIIAAVAVSQIQQKKEEIKNSDAVIMELDTASVDSLSWKYGDQELSFHKEGDEWKYDEDDSFPVNAAKVTELLEVFNPLGASFEIDNVTDFAQYGLEDPECTINIGSGDTKQEIVLGAFSTLDSQRYLSVGDGKVYLVSEDPMEKYELTLTDLVRDETVPYFTSVAEMAFDGEESYKVVFDEESTASYNSNNAYFAVIDGEEKPVKLDNYQTYLHALYGTDLTQFAVYNATEDDVTQYGMNDPELTITMDYTAEGEDGNEYSDTYVLNVSRDSAHKGTPIDFDAEEEEETTTAESSSEEEKDQYTYCAYARVGDSQVIYKLKDTDYEALMGYKFSDLRYQELFGADFAIITGIEATIDGTQHMIEAKTEGDKTVYTYNGEEIDITDIQSAIEKLTADEFTTEALGDKEELTLTLYLDNENHPQITYRFERYDGADCAAYIDDEMTALVPRSQVVALIEALNAVVL